MEKRPVQENAQPDDQQANPTESRVPKTREEDERCSEESEGRRDGCWSEYGNDEFSPIYSI